MSDTLWIAVYPLGRPGRYSRILGTGTDAETAERQSAKTVYGLFDDLDNESWEEYQNAQWIYGKPRHLVIHTTEQLQTQLLDAIDNGLKCYNCSGYEFEFAILPWIGTGDRRYACTIEEAKNAVKDGWVEGLEGIEVGGVAVEGWFRRAMRRLSP